MARVLNFKSLSVAAAVSVVLGMAQCSQAALLAYEGFSSYTAGTNLNGLSAESGWGAGWNVGLPGAGFLNEVRNAAPLSYANYTGSTTPAASGGNYGNLAAGWGEPTFNWAQRDVDVTGAFASYNDGTRVGADGTTLYGSFLYNNSGGGEFWLQGATNHMFGALPTTLSNSLYVFKLAFGASNADTLSVYSNPTLPGFDINTATPTATFTGDLSFKTIVFVAPGDKYEVRFDDIRLGTAVGDVIPVPEPTSIALLGTAVTGLAMRRRRA